MLSRDFSSTAEPSHGGCKNAKAFKRAVRVAIATCTTLGLAAPAGAVPHPDPAPYPDPVAKYHHHHRHHHHKQTAKQRAHKTDLSGYEFELIVEGTHSLTRDEELGNQAAVEAVEHPGPPVTPREEETPAEPEG